jgi:hypothetical protein
MASDPAAASAKSNSEVPAAMRNRRSHLTVTTSGIKLLDERA